MKRSLTTLRRATVGLVILATCGLLTAGCRGTPNSPLPELSRLYDRYPQYSIILSDMDVSGNFFKSYHHRYKILYSEQAPTSAPAPAPVAPPATEGTESDGSESGNTESEGSEPQSSESTGNPSQGSPSQGSPSQGLGASTEPAFTVTETGWMEVAPEFFLQHEPHLGMVIFSKGNSKKAEAATYPPGYQYVGNSRYGTWRTDRNGTSFWEFYGAYVIFNHLRGNNGPIYRSDYDSYRDSRRRRQPYFGTGNAYGTRGTFTRASNPTFYERQQVRQRTQSDRFAKKARSRTSSSRSRSRSRGK